MKTKYRFYISPPWNPLTAAWAPPLLLLSVLASSAQTNIYQFTGSKTNITLSPGLYQITVYGGQGSYGGLWSDSVGGLGAEMSAEFSFSGPTTLALLVGGAGSHAYISSSAGGGGGGSFVVNGSTPLIIAGGGGGGASYFDLQADGGNGLISGGSGGGGAYGGGSYSGGGGGGYSGDGGGTGAAYGGGYGGRSFLNGGEGGPGGGAGGYGGGGSGAGSYFEGGGGGGGYSGGDGGYGSHRGYPYPSYGGRGGSSYIDSSAIRTLTAVSGIASPDPSGNGVITITAVPQPGTLSYHVINGNLVLEWPQGTLVSAGTVNGSYTPVNGASSPYTNSITGPQQYFRVLAGTNLGVSQKQ